MRRVVTLGSWAALAVALLAGVADAQPREPLGGFAVDLRALTVSLPTGAGWTPPVTRTGTAVPNRGLGVEAGAHLLVGPGQFRRLSVGVSGLLAEGRATGVDPAGVDTPTVATRLLVVAPHAALNFGHRHGWSYLSLGAGRASVRSSEGGVTDTAATWGPVFHYGGGARWFLAERVAVSLDLRFWALTPRPATVTRTRAAATTRVAFGVGVSFR